MTPLVSTTTRHVSDGHSTRGSTRLIYHADGHPYECVPPHHPLHPGPEDLYHYVDALAEAGVGMISLMGFCDGEVTWTSDLATRRHSKHPLHEPTRLRLEALWEQGLEPLDIYARRCHEQGQQLLVKFRMNDCHSCGRLSGHYNMHMGEVIQAHQEWWLKDYPGQLDYTHQGVRDWLFDLAHEVTTRFDTDGLTFNYIRYPYVFERAESRAKMPILTEFMRRVRAMLDAEGARKGRRLHFCVIVAPTVEECLNFGLDVPTWIDEEIVDSVCPCHFDNTLFNTSYEGFAELARAKKVYLFPALHPSISPYLYYFGYMTQPAYRAAVRNLYASGADGLSVFNYYSHWSGGMTLYGAGSNNGRQNYPRALHFLTGLSMPDNLERGDRHYVYWRCRDSAPWPGFLDRHRVLSLPRTAGAQAEWPLRCAETFDGNGAAGGSAQALLRFNAVNLLPGDEIEVSVNNQTIPAASLARRFRGQGRTNIQEGMKLPPYTEIMFSASTPPFEFMDNFLGLKLLRSAAGATGEITVPEIEIAVAATGGDPRALMDMMKDGPYPAPTATLAGYHPDLAAIGPVLMGGDLVENELVGARASVAGRESVSAGAQSFALAGRTTIGRVEVCIYRIPEIRAPLRLSLRADANGAPATGPMVPGAVAAFDPWQHPEQVGAHMFQGYYRFAFEAPLTLDAGRYWLLLEMDPAGQPPSSVRWGDPPAASCYAPALTVAATEHYPQGHYLTWDGAAWRPAEKNGRPVSAFFGVFAPDAMG
jgi:hypothetical protein